jgi:hypothetical protein
MDFTHETRVHARGKELEGGIDMKITTLFIGLCLIVAPAGLWAQEEEKKVAILNSSNAAKYFGIHYPPCWSPENCTAGDSECINEISGYLGPDEFKRYLLGWTYTLDKYTFDNNLDKMYEVIDDSDLNEEGLSPYRVLILPNTPSISDDSAKAIRKWVLRGGRLLATFGSGYKQIFGTDPHNKFDDPNWDEMKLQEGGTNGLHQLWKDPLGKMATSSELSCTAESLAAGDKSCCLNEYNEYEVDNLSCAFVDVVITDYTQGPTINLKKMLSNDVLLYGALGNMLIQRPMSSDRVLAYLVFDHTNYSRPSPAIIVSDASKGRVVYFAFAPEFIIGLNNSLPIKDEISYPLSDDDYDYCVGDWEHRWEYPESEVDHTLPLMQLMTDTVLYLLDD